MVTKRATWQREAVRGAFFEVLLPLAFVQQDGRRETGESILLTAQSAQFVMLNAMRPTG